MGKNRNVLRSEHLELVNLRRRDLQALLKGRWNELQTALDVALSSDQFEGDMDLVELRLRQIEQDPDSEPWLLRALILMEPRTYIGYFNFHGPPSLEGWVEMGYSILPEHQRRGYATEAALRMMRWANDEHGSRSSGHLSAPITSRHSR